MAYILSGLGAADTVETAANIRIAQQYLQIPADGIYGPQTAGALRSYQQSAGLPVTGHLDSATLASLQSQGPIPPAIAPTRRTVSSTIASLVPQTEGEGISPVAIGLVVLSVLGVGLLIWTLLKGKKNVRSRSRRRR